MKRVAILLLLTVMGCVTRSPFYICHEEREYTNCPALAAAIEKITHEDAKMAQYDCPGTYSSKWVCKPEVKQ